MWIEGEHDNEILLTWASTGIPVDRHELQKMAEEHSVHCVYEQEVDSSSWSDISTTYDIRHRTVSRGNTATHLMHLYRQPPT
jgi:hypothetical protein